MSVIVQKYGGSSVASPEKILKVASRVVATQAEGHQVVVVVSAMGNTTNDLLELAQKVSSQPQRRELDMLVTVGERITMSLLSMAIQDLGVSAISFTGSQSGIITTETHNNARITKVKPHRIQKALDQNKIVIVAGFQGVSEHLEITSLGRGGSDTTAVALAAALGAEFAEICSDVDGVYSADPRVAPHAQRVAQLSYEEMQTLADSGAKVLNAEAVEWAKRNQIEIICSATQGALGSGTSVSPLAATSAHEHPRVSAITHHPGLCYLHGKGDVSIKLLEILENFGLVESDVLLTGPLSYEESHEVGWACWAPIQNLHPVEPFLKAVQAYGAQIESKAWTLVSVIGRGLLSGGDQAPYLMAQKVIEKLGIEARGPEVSPLRLRWAVAEADAKSLVHALHEQLIEAEVQSS